jgi:hypothetical protein
MSGRWKNKKRKSKEHKEFLISFLKTDTYASLIKFLSHSRGRPLNDDGVYVEEYLKERKRKITRGEKKPEDDTKIQVT